MHIVGKIGNVKISSLITLKDVLYIPKFTVNLIYVPKLILDEKLTIAFENNYCYFQDFHSKKMIG